jgi:hypothetical protein
MAGRKCPLPGQAVVMMVAEEVAAAPAPEPFNGTPVSGHGTRRSTGVRATGLTPAGRHGVWSSGCSLVALRLGSYG